MNFGDKFRFLISLELNNEHGGIWLFGRICYWISGVMVGHYDIGTSLRGVLFQMTHIVGDGGKRFCSKLIHFGKEKIFALIEAALNEKSDEIYQYIPLNFLPARFDICIPVDVFNSWKLFLVEGDNEAKILYTKAGSTEVKEVTLMVGEFDRIFSQAHNYLECLYEEEIVKAGGRLSNS